MTTWSTCHTACESLLKVNFASRESWSRLGHPRASRNGFSTSSVSRNSFPRQNEDPVSPRHQGLTLLHKISKFLSATLEQKTTSGFARMGKNWDDVLSRVHEDLSSRDERPIKIAVYSLDEWSSAEELVTALLADPLSSNEAVSKALDSRWAGVHRNNDQVHITYGPDLKTGPSSLVIPSSYLSQFSVPIEIIEVRPSKPSPISDILENPSFLEADIPILVCNPFITPIPSIPIAQLPSNSVVVFSSSTPQSVLDSILEKQAIQTRSPRHSDAAFTSVQFLSADPKRAADAIRLLQSEPNSFAAIQRYQDDVVGSQLSGVTKLLSKKLLQENPISSATSIRTKLALGRINDVLCASSASIRTTQHELDQTFVDASNLGEQIEEITAKVYGAVFERRNEKGIATEKDSVNEVALAVKQSEKEMALVMGRLSWWRMMWRVDEIASIVAAAVSRVWCGDLEKKLILQTGRLGCVQRDTSESAFDLTSKYPNIQSAILQNNLLQLKASPNYRLAPDSLTKPIHSRRDQIIEYPTNRLHITGQKTVFGMTGGVATGVGIGWAGWMGWLLGSGEGLLSFLGMEAGTAIGVGVLCAVATVRWGVGKWEKAKKRWWQDWTRVGEGLERDLKITLDYTMRQQVTVVARMASKGVSESVKKSEEDIAAVNRELQTLRDGLEDIAMKVSRTSSS